MSKIKMYIIISVCFCILSLQVKSQSVPLSEKWVKENFSKGKQPPFRFVYGQKNSKDFITDWKYSEQRLFSKDSSVKEFLFTYLDKQTGLLVKCFVTAFTDYNAVEWVIKFSNTSLNNLPILEKSDALNYPVASKQQGSFILHHARGSGGDRNDFMPIDDTLIAGKNTIQMIPEGGRSSDNTAFPFFNVETPSRHGVVVAVGWTGTWSASVRQTSNTSVSLRAGMDRMKLILYPGEEIRMPKICLLFWKGGDRMIGHNQFRRFILAHHSPKINGRVPELPLSSFLARGGPRPCNEHLCATEMQSVAQIRRQQQFKIMPEVFWLDAGWYAGAGNWWGHTGTWETDTTRFPKGLKPVSDIVHQAGSKFLLWFEPERVYAGTKIAVEHPERVTALPDNKEVLFNTKNDFLFNMGDSVARMWITDHITELIKKEGVDYYRQDFNMKPMDYWIQMDKADRTGISEIRHIEGLYAFWDSLLVRFPNLVIDNCASGGRRLDLESMSRSYPFWRTDHPTGESNGYQCHTYGINFYLPVSGTCNVTPTPYGFRSSMGSSLGLSWDINSSSGSLPQFQKCIADFKRLRPYYYYSDYYPLTGTKNMLGDDVWLSYQLDRPDKYDGLVMAFRRKDAPDSSITVKLRGLEKNANYEVHDEDSDKRTIHTGAELMNGLVLIQQEKLGSLLIMYRKI